MGLLETALYVALIIVYMCLLVVIIAVPAVAIAVFTERKRDVGNYFGMALGVLWVIFSLSFGIALLDMAF